MSEKKRFHPLALVLNVFSIIKAWWFLILLAAVNLSKLKELPIPLVVAVVLFLLGIIVIFAVIKYFSEAYIVTPEKVVIFKGVFRKSETDIPYERMQTIKQRQWFFFKPFRVTEILIETAGGDSSKAEASMPAVPESLLTQIESYRHREVATDVGSDSVLSENAVATNSHPGVTYKITNQQIFMFSMTDLSLLAVGFAGVMFLLEYIPEGWIEKATSMGETLLKAGWVITLFIVAAALIIIIVASLIKNFLAFYDFRVTRSDNTLTIERGLLERRVQKIPLGKIQGIRIKQQILRKLLGLSSVELLLAGGQEKEGEENAEQGVYFLPIINDRDLFFVLDDLLPEWDFDEPTIQYVSRKKLWYFWRWVLLIGIPATIAALIFNHILGAVVLAISLLLLLTTFLDAYFQGYALQSTNRLCVQTFLIFTKVQTFVERPRIQAFEKQSTPFLIKKQIGSAKLWVKQGSSNLTLSLRFMDWAAVEGIEQFFLRKK